MTIQPDIAAQHRARLSRQHDEAVALLSKSLAARPQERTGRSLGRLLNEIGQPDQARDAWKAVLAERPHDLEALTHLAAMRLRAGATADAAACSVAGDHGQVIVERITRELTDPIATVAPGHTARHVAITGVSFSGSTLLDRVLGGLPGVKSIGESHWLTKSRINKVSSLVDARDAKPEGMPYCSVCHTDCDVLSLGFRLSLAANSTSWYQKIAHRLGTRLLVSADKNWPKLLDNDPLLRMDAIVLFKSPLQAWHSHKVKLPAGQSEGYYLEQLERYIDVWCSNYEVLYAAFQPNGTKAFVSFDAFCEAPHKVLEAVCSGLDLPSTSRMLEQTQPGHAIGGNRRAMGQLRQADYAVTIDPLPDPAATAEERRRMDADPRVNALHEALLDHAMS